LRRCLGRRKREAIALALPLTMPPPAEPRHGLATSNPSSPEIQWESVADRWENAVKGWGMPALAKTALMTGFALACRQATAELMTGTPMASSASTYSNP